MTGIRRPACSWVVIVLLGALVATNVAFLVVMRAGGPLIGIACYTALLVVSWRRRPPDYRPAAVGGLVGLAVHAVEVISMGWTSAPLLMALNLILPAILVPAAWLAGRQGEVECAS